MTHIKKLCFTLLGSLSLLLIDLPVSAMPRMLPGQSQIQQLAKSASAGNATDQNALGLLYLTGATPNYAKGLYWLNKSAKQGNPTAQYNLGLIYQKGFGKIKPDYSKAKFWLTQSSNQGYKLAQNSLASLNHLATDLAGNLTEKSDQAANWIANRLDPYRIDSQ